MQRREFVTLVGGAAAAWPLAARAEQMQRVGVLLNTSENDRESLARIAVLEESLVRLGWTVGRNIRIDYRWYGGDRERARTGAAELLALSPDAVVANANAATSAFHLASRSVPIVFTVVTDPVGEGFVQNLARPGGNITGFTNQPTEGAKFLELLKEIAPGVKRVSFMTGNTLISAAIYQSAETAAPKLTLEILKIVVRDFTDIEPVLTVLAKSRDGGLIIAGDAITSTHREQVIRLASQYRIPAVYGFQFFAREGGLLSYGIDIIDQFRQVAGYVDRILRGAKPAELPVQQPTRFEMVINLKTAKALGVTIPQSVLLRADRVIE